MKIKNIGTVQSEIRAKIFEVFPDMKFSLEYSDESYKQRSGFTHVEVKYNIDGNGNKNFSMPKVRLIIRDYFRSNFDNLQNNLKGVETVTFSVGTDYSKKKPNQVFVNNAVNAFKVNGEVSKEDFINSVKILASASHNSTELINYNQIIEEISNI